MHESTHMKQQISLPTIRAVFGQIMTSCNSLIDFQHNVTFGTREMIHSISEVGAIGFSWMITARVYQYH